MTMRKIISGLFISLDGVVESPDKWHFPYFSDEMGALVGGGMQQSDAVLLGRQTYTEFAAHWPHQGDDVPLATELNSIQKYVVSTTLDSADWNNTQVLHATSELTAIKALPGQDISMIGSPTLVRNLLAEGLLDELRLFVHPIVVNGGKRLFTEGPTINLELAEVTNLPNGVQYLVYKPAT
jgi:dihydrofolate reductase